MCQILGCHPRFFSFSFSPLAFDDSAKRRGEGGKRQPLLFLPFSFPHCILSPGEKKKKVFPTGGEWGKKIFPLLFWRRRARRRRKVFYLGERGGGGGRKKRTGIRRSEEAKKKFLIPSSLFCPPSAEQKTERTKERNTVAPPPPAAENGIRHFHAKPKTDSQTREMEKLDSALCKKHPSTSCCCTFSANKAHCCSKTKRALLPLGLLLFPSC